jgi:glycerol uptake facilitator-like aquaporin
LPRPSLARRCFAEAIATFALVFAGCGAIVANAERDGALGSNGIALTFGLVIMVMVYATGHLSGAHINPAVTAAFCASRHFPVREAALYIPAQLIGAVTGALLLRIAWDGTPTNLGATIPSVGDGSALAYEATMTAFLMFVIHGRRDGYAGRRGGCSDRYRRDRRPRRSLRGTRHRGFDESSSLVRPRARRE